MGLLALPWLYSLILPWIGAHIGRRVHAASAQVAFRFNSFIALALAERLAGAEGLLLIAILIGVCVPLFNVGAVWPMARHAHTGFLGALVRNPLIIATATGLATNLLGFQMPVWLEPTVTRIGAASLALGLMAAGAGLQFGPLASAKTLAVSLLAIRHIFIPLIALGLAWVFRLSPVQTTVLLAFSALPTASSCYVLAARMGYNGAFVAGLVTLSTLLGIVSLPFALRLALGLTGGPKPRWAAMTAWSRLEKQRWPHGHSHEPGQAVSGADMQGSEPQRANRGTSRWAATALVQYVRKHPPCRVHEPA